MTCKAYNGRVVCAWLASCTAQLAADNPGNQEYQLMAGCLPAPYDLAYTMASLHGKSRHPFHGAAQGEWQCLCHCSGEGRTLPVVPQGPFQSQLKRGFLLRTAAEADDIHDKGLAYLNFWKALTRLSLGQGAW